MAYTETSQTIKGVVEGSRAHQVLKDTEKRDTKLEKAHHRNTRIGQVLLGIALLLGWEFGSGTIVDQFFMSKPSIIAQSFISLVVKQRLFYHLQFTVWEAVLGFLIGAGFGLIIGFILARSDMVYRVVQPYVIAFYGIPRIALAPLFILWFGIGINSKIAVAAVMVFFIVLINTITGIRSVSEQLKQVTKVMGASEWDLNWKVIFPAAMPFIIAGLEIAVPQAMIGAIVGEFISSNRGVGNLINRASGMLDTPGLFAGILVLLVVVLLMNWAITLFGNSMMKWNPKYGNSREKL